MDLSTRDVVMKKLLDAQENVRDYESYSKRVDDKEVINVFKSFAEESGYQAQKLQELLHKYDQQ